MCWRQRDHVPGLVFVRLGGVPEFPRRLALCAQGDPQGLASAVQKVCADAGPQHRADAGPELVLSVSLEKDCVVGIGG